MGANVGMRVGNAVGIRVITSIVGADVGGSQILIVHLVGAGVGSEFVGAAVGDSLF